MARPRRPSSSPERLLFLSFLLVAAAGSAVLLVAAKAAASALIKNNSSGENNSESNATAARRRGPLGAALFGGAGSLWDADLFHLPPEVPFPGGGWLSRIADETTAYANPRDGQAYSSAYEAMVGRDPLLAPCRNMNAWLNSLLFSPRFAARVAASLGHNAERAHYALCYLRNFLGAMVVYYGTAGAFHFFCYVHPMSKEIFAKRARPAASVMWDQIRLAQLSMILYVLLPVADEYLIERGWTRAYYTVAEIGGWGWYAAYTLLYFCLVEIGIYWMHRTLHTNKFLYKHVHLIHHKYNAPHTLTPWASIAFHPLDGILQASPYVLAMLLVPCHYPTHFGLLFFTAIWATYIHDAMDLNVWPVMGSKYHTIHHTHYIYNYGQVFVFCDVLWGTFREPSGPTGVVSSSPAAADGSRARAPTRARPVTSRVGGGKGKRS